MEPNDHHHHHSLYFSTPTAAATTAVSTAPSNPPPSNGLIPPNSEAGTLMVYPHSVGPSTAVVSAAPVERKKRGRPRKYGTPEQALAAKKTAAAAASSVAREKREGAPASSLKKAKELIGFGNAGQGFTPHIISVSAGEDVMQKLYLFLQQSKREMCILSASGSISNVSLRQPAASGGSITYEGRFGIISLMGSYIRTDIGGRTGGLSICLSSTDGQIIGGGVGGPLKAAGPVQVIVGTFVLDKKDDGAGPKGDASASKSPPTAAGGSSISGVGFNSPVESSGRTDHQNFPGNPFLIQQRGMSTAPSMPTDWRSGPDARSTVGYDLTGRVRHGTNQSPENGDYDQLPE